MKLRLVVCAAALLAACSPEVEAPAEGTGAAQKRMPLPDCASVETQDAGAEGWKHPDCRLMFMDESKLALEARYTPAEDDSTKISVQIVAPGDATLQTIEETMGNTFNGVTLQDIDKDSKLDIQIPLETGNVNTSWAIWRQRDDKSFIRVGEPNGVSIEKTASGYIAVQARSSANEWGVAFYKLEDDELKPVATADVVAQGEPDKITGVACTLIDDGGLAAANLTPEAAKARFCAEPVVADIFK
jgi:hypothetical protein